MPVAFKHQGWKVPKQENFRVLTLATLTWKQFCDVRGAQG